MKFKSLFLLFVFSIFSFASFDIQAKPTNNARTFSANRAKEAERLSSQKRQDACLLLQVFYVVREDTKKLTSIYNKACKSGLGNKDECTSTNISKTVSAAVRQIEDIKLIDEKLGLDTLPVQLQEIAQIRLDYPDTPLGDLGQYLDPPIGKSGVNHRLKKLAAIARELR